MEYKTEFSNGKKVLLIVNPKAGRTTSKAKAETLKKTFVRYGFVPDVYMTEHAGHATELAETLGENYDIIVCTGGDGTLHETVDGVLNLKKRPVLGYIPAGTTNDFAKSVKLQKLPELAVSMMTKGKIQKVDCGEFNGKRFVYIASFGAFTKVSYGTPQDVKNVLGRSAYLIDGIQSAFEIRPYHARITTDDAVYEDDFIFGAVANAVSVGGVINLPREMVSMSDGRFEVLLIRSVENPEDLPDTIRACIDLNFDHENVILTQSSHVKMEFEEKTPFTLDGEYAGDIDKVKINIINPGYDLLIP